VFLFPLFLLLPCFALGGLLGSDGLDNSFAKTGLYFCDPIHE